MKCPNCSEEIEECDLVSNEFGVNHCGCFYESDPDKVKYHFIKEIETEDYIVNQFKEQLFALFTSRNSYWLNERAKQLEEKLNCKIGTFEDLRTGLKKLTMEFEWYDLDKNKYTDFCKVIYRIVSEKDDLEMIHNLSEKLHCDKLEIESRELPEDDIVTITMEWKDVYALTDTP